MTLVKSIWSTNYWYNIFLEITSHELPKNYVFVLIIYHKNWRVKMNFKNINIKNYVCYYFDYIMRVIDN